MKAEVDLESAVGANQSLSGIQGEQSRLARLRSVLTEMKITTLLRLYRFFSLTLSSLLFLLFPGIFDFDTQLALIFLVFATGVLLILLYEHFWKNTIVVSTLVVIEALGIALLLAFTGGFNGPFLWYALNPFIVASAIFSFALAWLILGMLAAGTMVLGSYFSFANGSYTEITAGSYYPGINLAVIAFVIYLYTRMHLMMSERMLDKKSQQRELMSAQENLSANYHVFKGLSNFQRKVVYYSSKNDIYTTLINTLINIFPFQKAAILVFPTDFQPGESYDSEHFQVISSNGAQSSSTTSNIQRELERRWAEFSSLGTKRILISENRQWIALPLRGEKKAITAVFLGWLKPRVNPLSFAENLSLFIRFAEQTTEWLSMFKQKERVLQHISAVYEAVETVSSQNDPRVVIDLFASYARALTDSDKTIFWMENTGDLEDDDQEPIYAVKGPREIYPEEEWEGALLKAWSEICVNHQPVTTELDPESGSKNLLISVPVKTSSHCSGMLSCLQSNNTFSDEEIIQILSVLADLSAIAVVRAQTEKFAEKLLVVEEQKRIACEIHDSISQNLFSIVYSIDALTRDTNHLLDEIQHETLQDVKNLSAETARELRALIYRLNPSQEANNTFISQIAEYLDKMARMNQIQIKHTLNGSAEHLYPANSKALYRIIRESTANALRHGNCSEILVHLDITPSRSMLKVSDNGKGFDVQKSLDLYTSGSRLGIVNMRELALSLQGSLTIDSKPGMGTEVTCLIPTSQVSVE